MNKIESRHQLIRSLVMENKIHTQQELQELLELNGVEVTQSTLSRDIKLLNLVKITESGSSYYVINSIAPSRWEKRLRFYMEDALVMLKPVQHQSSSNPCRAWPNPLAPSWMLWKSPRSWQPSAEMTSASLSAKMPMRPRNALITSSNTHPHFSLVNAKELGLPSSFRT